MKTVDLFGYRRTCVLCLRSKPMKGAITHPRFICCECRERRESKRAAAVDSVSRGTSA